MGATRSAAALPRLPQARDASCASRTGVKDVPRLERNRANLHGRTYIASHPWIADKLVQRAAVDVSGFVVGFSVCRIEF